MTTKWTPIKWRKSDIEYFQNVFRNFELNRIQDLAPSDLEGIQTNDNRQ